MGSGNLHACREENIVALCDVDFKQSASTFKRYPKAKVYKDFRKMFEKQKDIINIKIKNTSLTIQTKSTISFI